jgi:hypothetical protein
MKNVKALLHKRPLYFRLVLTTKHIHFYFSCTKAKAGAREDYLSLIYLC